MNQRVSCEASTACDERSTGASAILVSLCSKIYSTGYFESIVKTVAAGSPVIVFLLDDPEISNSEILLGIERPAAIRRVKSRVNEILSRVPDSDQIRLMRLSGIRQKPAYVRARNVLGNFFCDNKSFANHCRNQVYKNLQPVLRKRSISKRDEEVGTLCEYLLDELAVKSFLAGNGCYREVGPASEMEISRSIRDGKYLPLVNVIHDLPYETIAHDPTVSLGLNLVNINHSYGKNKFALRDVSLSIPPRSSVGIIGPSGSGKSTLLRILGGHLRADSGNTYFHGTNITNSGPGGHGIFTVFQDHALFPRFTVEKNVQYAARSRRSKGPGVDEVLDAFGLGDQRHSFPQDLSGGQSQRTALARAIAAGPSVLLLDEPTSSLDTIQRTDLVVLLNSIREEYETTVIIVTHDYEFAAASCNQLCVMNNGTIVDVSSTQDMLHFPQSSNVATLFPHHSVLPGEVNTDGKFRHDTSNFEFIVGNKWKNARGVAIVTCDNPGMKSGNEETLELTGLVQAIADNGFHKSLFLRIGDDTVRWAMPMNEFDADEHVRGRTCTIEIPTSSVRFITESND